jgi:hypothetical protein
MRHVKILQLFKNLLDFSFSKRSIGHFCVDWTYEVADYDENYTKKLVGKRFIYVLF